MLSTAVAAAKRSWAKVAHLYAGGRKDAQTRAEKDRRKWEAEKLRNQRKTKK
jgi:hypothetical protein